MKKDEPFNYIQFIREFSQMSKEEALAMMGTEWAKTSSDYGLDCMKLGSDACQTSLNLSTREEEVMVGHATASAMAAIEGMNNSIETQAMVMFALQSDVIKQLCQYVFYYALGLSIKEEVR